MERLKNRVILIVDDDSRNTFALGSYLEVMELSVLIAENGEQALTLLKTGTKPDVILLDMMMPVIDGYQVLAILQSDAALSQIPVIAVTARAMKGDEEKCMEAGAWDYISKPIDLAMLKEKLIKWIK